jgi:hypothetical protein
MVRYAGCFHSDISKPDAALEFSHSLGHFDPFPPPRLNGRCPFSQPTSAGASGNGKDAPMDLYGVC